MPKVIPQESFPSKETIDRRNFFQYVSGGVYAAALTSLLSRDLFADDDAGAAASSSRRIHDLAPRPPHFEPRAKAIIHLVQNGGPSQMDLFDPKPELDKNHGKSFFEKIAGEVERPNKAGALMRCPFKFARHGSCGMWVSEIMPELAKCVDDITLIRSMQTTNLTHEPALFKIHSGQTLPGLPTLGAWVSYGLGSVNRDLPAYVVLDDPGGLPINGTQNWQSGFLPPVYQGTRFRSQGSPLLDLKPEFDEPGSITGLERDLIARLDRLHQRKRLLQPELGARIASYELAARMQLAASDALDLAQEKPQTREMYGVGKETCDSYARRCLLARRLVERGVRFVQIFLDGQPWDNHGDLARGLKKCAARTDQPVAGLLRDLKQRGLLDSTLVVWGGEFGRLPISEGVNGRDHNKNAMVTWMAGGGVKAGLTYGATDEVGFAATEDKISVTDWHATILHLLGLDHQKLFYQRNGLREKLTGVFEARVVKEILA